VAHPKREASSIGDAESISGETALYKQGESDESIRYLFEQLLRRCCILGVCCVALLNNLSPAIGLECLNHPDVIGARYTRDYCFRAAFWRRDPQQHKATSFPWKHLNGDRLAYRIHRPIVEKAGERAPTAEAA
jgi:hypothetical protein